MARRIAARDWSDTALGSPDRWSSTMRGAVAMLLDQLRPALLLVGADRTTLCNDAWHDRRVGAAGRWNARPPAGLDARLSDAWAGEPVRIVADGTAWSGTPIRDLHGRVEAVLATAIAMADTGEDGGGANQGSDRLHLEQQIREGAAELQQSRDLLQATMDSSQDMIQVFAAIRDDRGAIVDFRWLLNNHTSEHHYGEVRGESLLERNPGVVEIGIFDAFRRVTETGVPEQTERYYDREQFKGWYYQSVVKLGDGVATTTKDISAWKASQAEVQHLRDAMAQARIDESDARLAAVFEALPVGVLVTDAEGRTVRTNEEMARFLPNGLMPSRDDGAAPRWRAWAADGAVVPVTDYPGVRALRGERVMPGIEMLYTDEDGREIWTRVSAMPIRDGDGAVIGHASVITDIDALKRNAEALRASEERLRQFGDASQDLLSIRDAASLRWRYLTQAFEAIHGLSRDAAMAGHPLRTWLALVVPEDRRTVLAAIRRIRAGEPVTVDYRVCRTSDGAIRWLRDTGFPIRDGEGRVAMIGGIGKDITDAKAAQEALEKHEAFLTSAVEVGRLGLWDWDIRTDRVRWSDEHFRQGGYQVGEVLPSYQAWVDCLHPDELAGAEAEVRAAMAEARDYVREYRVVHPDGSIHWLHGRGRFFYDDHGAAIRMIGALVDVTERREWEERQKALVNELQHRTRNLIGVVRSISDKTARTSRDLADFHLRYRDRLDALARIQSLLSRLEDQDRVTFDSLVATELAATNSAAGQVTLDGPGGIRLRSSTVQILAMAIHELATNAVEHGALAQADGRLMVRWRFEPAEGDRAPWLHVDWRESAVTMPGADMGPDGVRVPAGSGQGRELIERALPYQLHARTSFNLGPDGVHCTISFPVSASTGQGHCPG